MTSVDLRDVRTLMVRHPLASAFAISLVLHLCFFGVWKTGQHLGWWQHQATWLLNWHKKKLARQRPFLKIPDVASARQPEVRLTFVEVDPSSAVAEPPKDARFYATKNTKATNPDEALMPDIPKIEGTQNKMIRLEDVPKPKPFPLQPAIEPVPAEKEAEPKPKADTVGDLAKAKPKTDGLEIGTGEAAKKERPRTLTEARVRNQLAGDKSKLEGGAKLRGRVSVSAMITPFSSYDAAFI